MSFQPVFDAFTKRPTRRDPLIPLHAMIRDQFPVSTWLLLGGLIQGIAHVVLPYRNIVLVLPVILFLFYKAAHTLLMVFGVIENPRMKNVALYRTVPVYPNEKGSYEKPGDASVCAIILAVVSNHPLGMLAPGFKEVGDRFDNMVAEMDGNSGRHGFLGASTWINAGTRTTSNEFMGILYFEDEHCLHEYAHGPMHTDTMEWWHNTAGKHKHVGIMHETFACPKKSWEGMYINYHPTGLASTTKEIINPDGKKTWMSPLVKGNGKLSYSKGRMGRAYGDDEWVAYEKMLAAGAGEEN